MKKKIRIKLTAYEHQALYKASKEIINAAKPTGNLIAGPVALPTKRKVFTVLRSPHVNKKSREQFQLPRYSHLIDIYASDLKSVEPLMKLELPSNVDIVVKL